MVVERIEVPPGTRLSFLPDHGPVTADNLFHDLGLVTSAERHGTPNDADELEDHRLVLDCDGVTASDLTVEIAWPEREPTLPGTVRFGDHSYPAVLQIRPRPHGLRAILRVVE